MSLFSVDNLAVHSGQQCLLQIDALTLPKNKITAIIGANGAGKSTFIHALIGKISGCTISGEVIYKDKPVVEAIQHGNIAWVGQHEQFNVPLTTLDYALLGTMPHLAWYQQPPTESVQRALQFLAEFDLLTLKDKRIQTLSGGEKQRLAMVRALMQDTDVLLLDEPTNHLDVKHQRKMFAYLNDMVHSPVSADNKSIIMVLHSLTDAYKYADYVVAFAKGELLAHGDADEVMTSENLSRMYEVEITTYDTPQGKIFV